LRRKAQRGSELIKSVNRTHRAQKLIAGGAPAGVISAHEKVGGAKVEARPENMSLPAGFLGQHQKLAFPVNVVRDARSDIAHLVQHAGFTDPTEPAVHLEVHADVVMQLVEADGEDGRFHRAVPRRA
jgi:hypothetical protein